MAMGVNYGVAGGQNGHLVKLMGVGTPNVGF
jgi:hypothetical protein